MSNRHGFTNSNSRQGFVSSEEDTHFNTYTAGAAITQFQFIALGKGNVADDPLVYPLDNADESYIEYIGVALNNAAIGEDVRVQSYGFVEGADGVWNFSYPGEPVFAMGGVDEGKGTQTIPTTAETWIIQVGQAVSTTEIIINAALSSTAVYIRPEESEPTVKSRPFAGGSMLAIAPAVSFTPYSFTYVPIGYVTFPPAVDSSAFYEVVSDTDWDGTPLDITISWTSHDGLGSADQVAKLDCSARAYENLANIDVDFSNAPVTADSVYVADKKRHQVTFSNVTPDGNSPTGGNSLIIRIRRLSAGDNFAGNLLLFDGIINHSSVDSYVEVEVGSPAEPALSLTKNRPFAGGSMIAVAPAVSFTPTALTYVPIGYVTLPPSVNSSVFLNIQIDTTWDENPVDVVISWTSNDGLGSADQIVKLDCAIRAYASGNDIDVDFSNAPVTADSVYVADKKRHVVTFSGIVPDGTSPTGGDSFIIRIRRLSTGDTFLGNMLLLDGSLNFEVIVPEVE